jgi:NADP-dependent 3-hydroxy acid dehydrogenase YdfG
MAAGSVWRHAIHREGDHMSRRVVVTGASSGIGAATVRRLTADGWDVVAVARRTERLQALAAETGAEIVTADLTRDEDVERLRAAAAAGGVDALVNNAGGAIGHDTIEAGSIDDWQRMFDVNVLATKRVTAALLPILRSGASAERPASIVTLTSTAGHGVYENGGGYNAAKYAEAALAAVLRLELAGEPIRVVEVSPGMVRTEQFALVRFKGDAERADAVYHGVENPLTAADIADIIAYTLSVPAHVNIDHVVVRPVAQAAAHKLVRGPLVPKEPGRG